MKTIKIADATPTQIDYLVAKIEGGYHIDATGLPWDADASNPDDEEDGCVWFKPSTNHTQGQPILDREGISVVRGGDLYFPKGNEKGDHYEPLWIAGKKHGRTALIAGLRCHLARKMGDLARVPKSLG